MGFEPTISGSEVRLKIAWAPIRADFSIYLESKEYSQGYIKDILHYLDRYFTEISSPTDIMRCFTKVPQGKRHLWLGFRTVFNFLEAIGYREDVLNAYRKALPTFKCGIDLKVPEENGIADSLQKLKTTPPKYDALYNVLVDSGLRLIEAVQIVKEQEKAEYINGFYRIALGEFRGSKQAYYAYLTEGSYKKLASVKDELLTAKSASRHYRKFGFICPKYIRKFAFDKMVELEVPESVADFIEGRVAKRIGAKHYMVLRRQADRFYPKYDQYLNNLRKLNCNS